MNNDSVALRLKQYLNAKGWNAKDFERITGLGNGTAAKLSEATRSTTYDRISNSGVDLNVEWLRWGEGEMLKPNSEELEQESFDESVETDRRIDIIPLLPVEAIAGGLQMWSQSVELSDCKKIVSPIPGADFAIHVSGDSMEPEIHNGTYIYIKRINDRAFLPWGNTMVVDTENGVVVKKLYPIEGDEEAIIAKSVNPAYPPFKIPTESIYGIYRVLGGSFVVSTL